MNYRFRGEIMETEKKGRGGFRVGAGRPKKANAKNTTVCFVCTKEQAQMLIEASKALNISKSEYICNLLFRSL